jgi:hypothetical protein
MVSTQRIRCLLLWKADFNTTEENAFGGWSGPRRDALPIPSGRPIIESTTVIVC